MEQANGEAVGLVRCAHCQGDFAPATMKSRGLCGYCYRQRDVREQYPHNGRRRGCWTPQARPWLKTDRQNLVALYLQGLSDREIADRMGRPVGGITKARQRLGLKVPKWRRVKHCAASWVGREASDGEPETL